MQTEKIIRKEKNDKKITKKKKNIQKQLRKAYKKTKNKLSKESSYKIFNYLNITKLIENYSRIVYYE